MIKIVDGRFDVWKHIGTKTLWALKVKTLISAPAPQLQHEYGNTNEPHN